MTNLDSILKSRDITLRTKVCLVKAIGFSNSQVWMWELDYKESWVLKNWCFWTVVLDTTLESPLDSKEIQPVNPKEISPEYSWEGLMLKQKLQYFAPDAKNWLIWKDPDAGKGWRWEEKGKTGDEMVRWHHQLDAHKFEKLLELVMDREAWSAAVHGVTKSWTWLRDSSELKWIK